MLTNYPHLEETGIDLCQEIIDEMTKFGFKQESIIKVQNSPHFVTSIGKPPSFQKAYLTLTLSGILNSSTFIAPQEIRLGLNMNGTPADWVLDIKIIVLPFLKENEETFFG